MAALSMTGPDTARIEKIKHRLVTRGIDALVTRIPENILYVSGYFPSTGGNNPAAIFTQAGDVAVMASIEDQIFLDDGWATDVRYYPAFALKGDDPHERIVDFIKTTAEKYKVASGRIAYEGNFGSLSAPMFCGTIGVPAVIGSCDELKAALPMADLIDGTDLLRELRGAKTPYELERMRRTAEITAMGNLACKEQLRPGLTEAEIAAIIETAIMVGGSKMDGAKRWRGYAFIGTGPRTAIVWNIAHYNINRQVENGDLVVIELHAMLDGYWSDYTRSYVVGKPTEKQREIGAVVAEAQRKAMEADRPGATGQEVDAAARKVVNDAGYGEYFPHHTGHGTGLCSHEPPLIHPNVPGVVLPEGATHSCEPGIYVPDLGIGIRIEDIVETTPNGARYLFDHDRNLD